MLSLFLLLIHHAHSCTITPFSQSTVVVEVSADTDYCSIFSTDGEIAQATLNILNGVTVTISGAIETDTIGAFIVQDADSHSGGTLILAGESPYKDLTQGSGSLVEFKVPVTFSGASNQTMVTDSYLKFEKSVTKASGSLILESFGNSVSFQDSVTISAGSLTITGTTQFFSDVAVDGGNLLVSGNIGFKNLADISLVVSHNIDLNGQVTQDQNYKVSLQSKEENVCLCGTDSVTIKGTLSLSAASITIHSDIMQTNSGDFFFDGNVLFSGATQKLLANGVTVTGRVTKLDSPGELSFEKTGGTYKFGSVSIPDGTLNIYGPCEVGDLDVMYFNVRETAATINATGNVQLRNDGGDSQILSDMIFSADSAVLTVGGGGSTAFSGDVIFNGDLTVTNYSNIKPTVSFQKKIVGGMSLTLACIDATLTLNTAEIDILDQLSLTCDTKLEFKGTNSIISAQNIEIDDVADLNFIGKGTMAPNEGRINSNSTSFVQHSGEIRGESITINYNLIHLATTSDGYNIMSTDGDGSISLMADIIRLENQGINSAGNVMIECDSECAFNAPMMATQKLEIDANSNIASSGVTHTGNIIDLTSSDSILVGSLTTTGGSMSITSQSLKIENSLTSTSAVVINSPDSAEFGSLSVSGGLTIHTTILHVVSSSTINGNINFQVQNATVAQLENSNGGLVIDCSHLTFTGPVKLTGGSTEITGSHLTFTGDNIFQGLSITTSQSESTVKMSKFTASSMVSIIGETDVTFSGIVSINPGNKMMIKATTFHSQNELAIAGCELDMDVTKSITFDNAISVDNAMFKTEHLSSTGSIGGTGQLNISAMIVNLLSISSDGGSIYILTDTFTVTGNIGGDLCTGITLPDCRTELSGESDQTINAGKGTLLASNRISKLTDVAYGLKIKGEKVEIEGFLDSNGALEIEATTITTRKLITSLATCNFINFQTSYILGNVECKGISFSGTTVEVPGGFLSAKDGKLTATGLLLQTNPKDQLELNGDSLTLGNVQASGNLEVVWYSDLPTKEVELEGYIWAPSINLNGGTLLLIGTATHELKAENGSATISFAGAQKKMADNPGDLALIGEQIHINGPVDIQNGQFTVVIKNGSLSADSSTNKISATEGIDINWPLQAAAAEMEIRSGSLIVLHDLSSVGTVNVHGDVDFNGDLEIKTLNVYANDRCQVLSNITATGAIAIHQGDLTLTGDFTQSLSADTEIRITQGEVKKSNGDLVLDVISQGGTGVYFGGKVTVGQNLLVNAKTTLLADADIGGRAEFNSLQVTATDPVSIIVGGVLVFNGDIEAPTAKTLEFQAAGISAFGTLTASNSDIEMRSPLEIHGASINVKNLFCYERVTFMNTQRCNVAAETYIFKGPVEGGTADVALLVQGGTVMFEMDVDMRNSPLSINAGVLNAKGNITAQRTITSQKDVILDGCGQQSVSAIDVLEGNLNKEYGDLVLTGQTNLIAGNLTVTGSLNTNGLKLDVGDIIAEGNADLSGKVIMGSAENQYIRVGGKLTVNDLVKTAVSIYLSGNEIALGTTMPAIKAEGGSVFYCGDFDCAACGDCKSCVKEIVGSPQGGQQLPKIEGSCLDDFPEKLMAKDCNPTQSPTSSPTPSPIHISASSVIGNPSSSSTKASSMNSINSPTCEPGSLNCNCLDDGTCNGELFCTKMVCHESSSLPTSSPITSTISSPTIEKESGADHGAQFSTLWVIFILAFVIMDGVCQ